MRISLIARHQYPAVLGGPSGGHVLDCLAKGLAGLGQDVFYHLEKGAVLPLPLGVKQVSAPELHADVFHVHEREQFDRLGAPDMPWVRTCHTDAAIYGIDRALRTENAIYVSQTLARTYGSDRYVRNGIVPEEYVYSERKSGYFLFLCILERALSKGLDIALRLSRIARFRLIVAGYSWDERLVRQTASSCEEYGGEYVGPVFGAAKANLLGGAEALLFPTKWNEGFGLVMAEALMSGTPVICSDQGACPELISPDAGYVCSDEEQYVHAVENIRKISPKACRQWATGEYHYKKMAAGYLEKYNEIAGSGRY